MASAVAQIKGEGPKLLALRSYLRAGPQLSERWSWTEQQIAAYEDSLERQALQLEIERVRAAFAKANPGFELYVNPAVRSIDDQIEKWNSSDSVTEAGARLLGDVEALLTSPNFPTRDAQRARQTLEAFLKAYVPEPTPTVAAPGLSPHGQMRAVDFQVEREGRTVAGPDSRTVDSVWQNQGWARKLETAVHAATDKFVGPLASPREPWHYTYTPDAIVDP